MAGAQGNYAQMQGLLRGLKKCKIEADWLAIRTSTQRLEDKARTAWCRIPDKRQESWVELRKKIAQSTHWSNRALALQQGRAMHKFAFLSSPSSMNLLGGSGTQNNARSSSLSADQTSLRSTTRCI